MKRIDTPYAVLNQFVDRDAAAFKPGTLLDASWLNSVQEELAGFIEANGITLNTADKTQLIQAMTNDRLKSISTQKDFDAHVIRRRNDYAGSGFVDLGNTDLQFGPGLWFGYDDGNEFTSRIHLGSNGRSAKVSVNGRYININAVNSSYTNYEDTIFAFLPPSPKGNEVFDLTTFTKTSYSTPMEAFAAVTAGQEVITQREDLILLEVWDEKVSDTDIVFPYGNVQCMRHTSPIGVTHYNNLSMPDDYFKLGEWDTTVKLRGHGNKWSTLSAANKAKYLQFAENNLRWDEEANDYVQTRFRVRVVQGLGNQPWTSVMAEKNIGRLRSLYTYNSVSHYKDISPRGKLTTFSELTVLDNTVGGNVFLPNEFTQAAVRVKESSNTFYAMKSDGTNYVKNTDVAYKGNCFCIPICTVSRGNQGAYHPSYNPHGTAKFFNNSTLLPAFWYEVFAKVNDQATCFTSSGAGAVKVDLTNNGLNGTVSGHPNGFFHNVIYDHQVCDYRLDARKIDVQAALSKALYNAKEGKTRGMMTLPFTKVRNICAETGVVLKVASAAAFEGNASYGTFQYQFKVNVNATTASVSNNINGVAGISMPGSFQKPKTGWIVYIGNNGNSYLSATIFNMAYSGTTHTFMPWIENDIPSTTITTARQVALNEFNTKFPVGTTLTAYYIYEDSVQMPIKAYGVSAPWQDIIARPDQLLAKFPNGIFGRWVPQLPDGTSKLWYFNEAYTPTKIIYNGTSWGTGTLNSFDSSAFSESGSKAINEIHLYIGLPRVNFTQEGNINNKSYFFYSPVFSDALYSNTPYTNSGGCLLKSILKKRSNDSHGKHSGFGKILSYSTVGSAKCIEVNTSYKPKNQPVEFEFASYLTARGIKAFAFITEYNGLLYVNWVYNELTTNGTDWGDASNDFYINNSSSPVYIANSNGTYTERGIATECLPIGIAY